MARISADISDAKVKWYVENMKWMDVMSMMQNDLISVADSKLIEYNRS